MERNARNIRDVLVDEIRRILPRNGAELRADFRRRRIAGPVEGGEMRSPDFRCLIQGAPRKYAFASLHGIERRLAIVLRESVS